MYCCFDGYQDGPSTKDHEHRRRLMKIVISSDVCVNVESEFSSTFQRAFLSNTRNKRTFIDLLADGLKSNGHTLRQSVSDADVGIVSSLLDIAVKGKMLLWFEQTQIFSSYFCLRGIILWAV